MRASVLRGGGQADRGHAGSEANVQFVLGYDPDQHSKIIVSPDL